MDIFQNIYFFKLAFLGNLHIRFIQREESYMASPFLKSRPSWPFLAVILIGLSSSAQLPFMTTPAQSC